MKAESQSMLIEEAQGQQTIQALFMQTSDREQAVILNCTFERNPEDGKLYYVFAGTSELYVQFRDLMADYGVLPAHEVPGHPSNPETAKAAAAAGEEAPVIDTAPNSTKSTADTGDNPPELSATEGETVKPEGDTDDASVRSAGQPANGGQPPAGDAGQAGASAGHNPDDRQGHAGEPGATDRGTGREAPVADAQRPVDAQGVAKSTDPFDMI